MKKRKTNQVRLPTAAQVKRRTPEIFKTISARMATEAEMRAHAREIEAAEYEARRPVVHAIGDNQIHAKITPIDCGGLRFTKADRARGLMRCICPDCGRANEALSRRGVWRFACPKCGTVCTVRTKI